MVLQSRSLWLIDSMYQITIQLSSGRVRRRTEKRWNGVARGVGCTRYIIGAPASAGGTRAHRTRWLQHTTRAGVPVTDLYATATFPAAPSSVSNGVWGRRSRAAAAAAASVQVCNIITTTTYNRTTQRLGAAAAHEWTRTTEGWNYDPAWRVQAYHLWVRGESLDPLYRTPI